MSKNLYSQSVIDTVNQYLSEMNSELDKEYCVENNILFQNDEVDMNTVKLFTKQSTDIAFELVYPEVKNSK